MFYLSALDVSRSCPDSSIPIWRERGAVEFGEIADPRDLNVGPRVFGEGFLIVCEMALPRKDGGDPVPPDRLNRGKDPQLVVDEDIVLRGIHPFDVVQLLLLVYVDQDIAVEGLPNAGAVNLAG